MKLIYTTLIILLAVGSVYSQKVIHENSYNLSGGVSFSYSDKDHPEYTSKTYSFVFNPSFTFHVIDIFALGGNILLDYVEEEIDNGAGNQKSITRTIGMGPKIRYYFHADNLAPFVDLSINYSQVLPSKTEGISFSMSLGLNYFFTKSIALEPAVSFVSSSYSNPDYNLKSFRVGVALNYHINE